MMIFVEGWCKFNWFQPIQPKAHSECLELLDLKERWNVPKKSTEFSPMCLDRPKQPTFPE